MTVTLPIASRAGPRRGARLTASELDAASTSALVAKAQGMASRP